MKTNNLFAQLLVNSPNIKNKFLKVSDNSYLTYLTDNSHKISDDNLDSPSNDLKIDRSSSRISTRRWSLTDSSNFTLETKFEILFKQNMGDQLEFILYNAHTIQKEIINFIKIVNNRINQISQIEVDEINFNPQFKYHLQTSFTLFIFLLPVDIDIIKDKPDPKDVEVSLDDCILYKKHYNNFLDFYPSWNEHLNLIKLNTDSYNGRMEHLISQIPEILHTNEGHQYITSYNIAFNVYIQKYENLSDLKLLPQIHLSVDHMIDASNHITYDPLNPDLEYLIQTYKNLPEEDD